jgi:Trp operon repressor
MPHISKQKLEKKLEKDIHLQLLETLSGKKSKADFYILEELLTETEKIMLAKRCAVIALLGRNVPHFRIWNMLKMSPATVARMANAYEAGVYSNLIKHFENKKVDFWKLLEKILQAGLPERGKGRWKWLDEMGL